MNPNFTAQLIESRYRTQEAERRATFRASLGMLPNRPWFAWLRRQAVSNQPVALAPRQSDATSPCTAKAA